MTFKKINDVSRSEEISEEEMEQEEILVKVEHVDVKLRILDQVEEEAQDAENT
jgi:hypothetical protein